MQKTKTGKHLTLHRQTLRVLSPGELTLAGGGGTTTGGTVTLATGTSMTQDGGSGTVEADGKVTSAACHG